MTTASAPGKIILFGEHAVVYGRPAIAIPIRQVSAIVEVASISDSPPGHIHVEAPDIGLVSWLHEMDSVQPLARIIHLTLDEIGVHHPPALGIRISSSIPISSGLGSGTAVSIAIVRSLSTHLGHSLPLKRQSGLAYEVEKIHHGTPSGIDNTVITYAKPVYYERGRDPKILKIGAPFSLVIGDTGVRSPTAVAVEQVRKAWQEDQDRYEAIFDEMGKIVAQAKEVIIRGQSNELGPLMDHNQILLKAIGVNSPSLQTLIEAARTSGAQGAKLSGAGLGGNMIALVDPVNVRSVEKALQEAGAVRTLTTEVAK
jgi:mevalonate kinase